MFRRMKRRERETVMDEMNKMLEETIEECDELAAQGRTNEPEICVSASEEETKLFWEVTTEQQLAE